MYHGDAETGLARIVGFEVEPYSVKHKYDGKWDPDRPELKTCNPANMKFVTEKDPKQEIKDDEEIIFTYDVVFKVEPGPKGRALVEAGKQPWSCLSIRAKLSMEISF